MGPLIFILICFIIGAIIFFTVIIKIVSSGNKFRDNSQKITVGMSMQEVESIMGKPSYTKTHNDNSIEFIYEKSEWKGYFRGGTKVRRMEIVFSTENKVISIGKNANCNMSGW